MNPATVLHATRIFDGERLLDGPHEVHVEEGRISAVLPSRGTGENVSTDFDDATVLPGLVDAHVHLCFDASPDVGALARADTPSTAALRSAMNARAGSSPSGTTCADTRTTPWPTPNSSETWRRGSRMIDEASPEASTPPWPQSSNAPGSATVPATPVDR
jgi:imidazolonepropionase-like amidohydrolase